jgi:hypothetical protein
MANCDREKVILFAVGKKFPLDLFFAHGQDVGMVKRSFLLCAANLLLTVPSAAFNLCGLQQTGFSQAGVPVSLIVKHAEGRGVGYREGYSTVEGFWTPAYPLCNVFPFIDGRLHILDRGTIAANVGGGLRWLYGPCAILGVNCYYDFRQTRFSHYHQVGPGVEVYLGRLEGRVNGYIPVRRHQKVIASQSIATGPTFAGFTGNGVLVSQSSFFSRRLEGALTGVDGEVGVNLISPNFCRKLYIGGGPYYFSRHFHHFNTHNRHHRRRALGGRGRVYVRANRYLAFEFCESWDEIYHNSFEGRVIIDFPIYGSRLRRGFRPWHSDCCRCCLPCSTLAELAEPPHRQELIVLNRRSFSATTSSLQSFCNNVLFVNNTAPPGGNGTIQAPFNTLAAASAASVPGSVFYVFQGDGTTTGMNQGIVLQPNQVLMGSGCAQFLACAGVTIPPQTAGPPVITQTINPDNTPVILMADNSTVNCVHAVQYNANSFYVIWANGNENVTVVNSIISQFGSDHDAIGIVMQNVTGANNISNNNFMGNGLGTYGVVFIQGFPTGSPVATATLNNNTALGWTNQGAFFFATQNNAQFTATISNNVLTSSGTSGGPGSGIFVQSANTSSQTLTITNNVCNNNGGNGMIFIAGDTSQLNLTAGGNTILSTSNAHGDGNGFEVAVNNSAVVNLTAFNNTVSNSATDGIAFNAPSPTGTVNATLTGNTANGNGAQGIATFGLMAATATLRLQNNTTVNNASGDGVLLLFTGPSGCVRFNNNVSSGVQQLSNLGAGTLRLETPQIGNTPPLTTAGVITPVAPGTCN